MKLKEIMDAIGDLGKQIRAKSLELQDMAAGTDASAEALEKVRAEIADLSARQRAMKVSYDIEQSAQAGKLAEASGITVPAGIINLGGAGMAQKKEEKPMSEIRKSNEYVRAFAFAVKNGLNRRTGRNYEQTKILYDALTESGGTTPGEDGGFLVPIDIDNTIRELRRELNPLADLFSQENVTAPTGWRVMDTQPTTGMTLVNEMGTIPQNDQPAFTKVPYSLDKYGLIVPVSNELLSDEAANLMGYLSRWFARKLVLTENALLLTPLQALTAATLTNGKTGGNAVDGVKTVLNKVLDPAISAGAWILCNQNGFDELDQLKDDDGRGLLQPDPTNPTQYRIFGRNVKVVSNASMPDTGSNTDFYIGDFREFATLFRKDGFEVASTDVGGNAWHTDSVEVRGIARLGVTTFDTAAVVRRNLAV